MLLRQSLCPHGPPHTSTPHTPTAQGAILFEETLFQKDPKGKPFVDVLNGNGIIPGIKVDTGLKPLLGGGEGENWCAGLDTLAERAPKFYEQGARFAKWRTALKIDEAAGCPTNLAIEVAAQDLARYARICQESGLVRRRPLLLTSTTLLHEPTLGEAGFRQRGTDPHNLHSPFIGAHRRA